MQPNLARLVHYKKTVILWHRGCRRMIPPQLIFNAYFHKNMAASLNHLSDLLHESGYERIFSKMVRSTTVFTVVGL
jgi:hypothetical protein